MKTVILLDKRTSYSIKRYTMILFRVLDGEIYSFGSTSTFITLLQKYFILPFKLGSSKPLNIILPSEGYSYLLPFLKKHQTTVICHDLHDIMNLSVSNWRKCFLKFYLKYLKDANNLIAISEHTKQDFTKLFGKKFTLEMMVVPNPIEDFWFDVIEFKPKMFDNLNNVDFILIIGSIAWYKNLDRAFEALAMVSNIKIVRVGPVKIHWLKLIGADRLIVYDSIEDVELQWLYQNAKLLFFPSIHEGFGWPLLEAMASKCAIVTAKKASIPEVCEDAVVYIDPYDVNSMSDSIEEILNDDNQLEKLRVKGYELALSYKPEAFYRKILKIVNE